MQYPFRIHFYKDDDPTLTRCGRPTEKYLTTIQRHFATCEKCCPNLSYGIKEAA